MKRICQLAQRKLLLCKILLDIPQDLLLGGVLFLHKNLLGQLLFADLLQHLFQQFHQLPPVNGFQQIIHHIEVAGPSGILELVMAGNNDETSPDPSLLDLLDHIQPCHSRHIDVHKGDKRFLLGDQLQSLKPVARRPADTEREP